MRKRVSDVVKPITADTRHSIMTHRRHLEPTRREQEEAGLISGGEGTIKRRGEKRRCIDEVI